MELYNGDCLEVMKSIPDDSVNLVLTDPPSGVHSGHRPCLYPGGLFYNPGGVLYPAPS